VCSECVAGPKKSETCAADDQKGFNTGQDLKLVLGLDLSIVDANLAATKAWGLPLQDLVGKDFSSFFENPDSAHALHGAALNNGRAQEHFLELKPPTGATIYLLCRAELFPGDDFRVLVTARNITERDSLAAAFFESQERFRIAFEFASVGIGMIDLDGNIFEVNNQLCEIFGYGKEELQKMNVLDFWLPEERATAQAEYRKAAAGAKSRTIFERRYLNKQGEILIAEVTRGLARSQDGKPLYFIVSFRDITESKRLQLMLEEQASTDPLTGTMNRTRIEERASFELMRSDRYGDKLSLVMIDLDNFKVVNDTYGHRAGDRVLRGFCDIARNCLRATDVLGRWGGEEFVALLPETSLKGAQLLADRLRTTLEALRFDSEIKVTASLGVAGYREGDELATLMGRADAALYRAKQAGRNRVVVDQGDMDREAAHRQVVPQLVSLHWKPSYRSGQPLIDAEHQELFELTNLIIVAMAENGAEAAVLPMIRELIAHVRAHFAHEDKLLRGIGYPHAEEHAEIHRNLVERSCELAQDFEKGHGSGSTMLGFLIYDVVAKHMLKEDRKFFPFLKGKHA
jgi:diguanylate cyclase (GGDEF)-like protein/hemerythrin-like metal-binding protein/PAS domain S-box-containing protein